MERGEGGAIDYERGGDAILAQASDEGQDFPMSPWNTTDNPLTACGAPAQPRHAGRGASFINEHQPCRIKVGLVRLPGRARLGHVRPLLLAGVHDFF